MSPSHGPSGDFPPCRPEAFFTDEHPAPLPMLASGHILDLLWKGLPLEPLLVSCDGGQGGMARAIGTPSARLRGGNLIWAAIDFHD